MRDDRTGTTIKWEMRLEKVFFRVVGVENIPSNASASVGNGNTDLIIRKTGRYLVAFFVIDELHF